MGSRTRKGIVDTRKGSVDTSGLTLSALDRKFMQDQSRGSQESIDIIRSSDVDAYLYLHIWQLDKSQST